MLEVRSMDCVEGKWVLGTITSIHRYSMANLSVEESIKYSSHPVSYINIERTVCVCGSVYACVCSLCVPCV